MFGAIAHVYLILFNEPVAGHAVKRGTLQQQGTCKNGVNDGIDGAVALAVSLAEGRVCVCLYGLLTARRMSDTSCSVAVR